MARKPKTYKSTVSDALLKKILSGEVTCTMGKIETIEVKDDTKLYLPKGSPKPKS
jgi:uncharacterized cupin superfamily protein